MYTTDVYLSVMPNVNLHLKVFKYDLNVNTGGWETDRMPLSNYTVTRKRVEMHLIDCVDQMPEPWR